MKNWIQRNVKNIIVTAFVIPILLVAFVSISHVTSFYGISNPMTWALYLSVGIEIAALSALAAVSVNMGRFVYLPFFIVTLIQMVGNIFFSFSYIDENGQQFKDWVEMVGPLFENMGVDRNDYSTHKTIISFISGGLLPIISLTFAHMLVKFSENEESGDKEPEKITEPMVIDLPEMIAKKNKEDEKLKYTPTKEQLDLLEKILNGGNNGTEQAKSNYEVYSPNEEELSKLQEILGLDNFLEKSKVKFNLQEENDEINFESKIDEKVTTIQDDLEVNDGVLENNIETINEPDVSNEDVPELTQVESQVLPHSLIVENSSTYDDKKKIDELFQKNEGL